MNRDVRLYSRNIQKDIAIRLKKFDSDLEQVFKDVVLDAHATNDKWKRKHLEEEAREIIKIAKEMMKDEYGNDGETVCE